MTVLFQLGTLQVLVEIHLKREHVPIVAEAVALIRSGNGVEQLRNSIEILHMGLLGQRVARVVWLRAEFCVKLLGYILKLNINIYIFIHIVISVT